MEYKLIFEGPEDDSQDTLMKLRGALIADLNLSIDQVKTLIATAPAVLKISENQEELLAYCHSLRNAGGKVLVVAEKAGAAGEEMTIELETAGSEQEEAEIEISLGEEHEPETPKEPKTYFLELSDDSGDELSAILEEFDDKKQKEEETAKSPAASAMPQAERAADLLSSLVLEDDEPSVATAPVYSEPKTSSPHKSPDGLALEFGLNPEVPSSASATEAPKASPKTAPPAPSSASLDFDLTLAAEPDAPPQKLIEKSDATLSDNDGGFDLTLKPEQGLQGESAAPKGQSKAEETPPASLTPKTPASSETAQPAVQAGHPAASQSTAPATPPAAAAQAAPDRPSVAEPPAPRVADLKRKVATPPPEPEEPATETMAEEAECKPRRKRLNLHLEVVVPAIVGVVFLAGLNWLLFSTGGQEDTGLPATENLIAQEAAAPKPAKEKEKKAPPAEPVVLTFTGKNTRPDAEIASKFTFVPEKKTLLLVGVTVTTPQPPELTDEDRVYKRNRAPWLESLEIQNLQITVADDGSFAQETQARGYVESWQSRQRVVAGAKIEGRVDPSGSVIATLSAAKGEAGSEPDNSVVLEPAEDGIHMAVRLEFSAEKQEPPPAPVTEQE